MARSFSGGTTNTEHLLGSGQQFLAGVTAFTIHAWIKRTGTLTAYGSIAITKNAANDYQCGLDYANTTTADIVRGGFQDSLSAYYVAEGTTALTSGQWYSAMVVYDGSNVQLYLDNVAEGSAVSAAGLTVKTVSSPNIYIGRNISGSNAAFPGDISEIAVWDAALNSNERAALARGVRASKIRPASLQRYWRIDGLESPEPDDITHTTVALTGSPTPGKANHAPVALFTPKISAWAEAAAAGQIYTRTLSDSVSTSDAAARAARAFRKMPQDAIALLDLVTKGKMHGRTASDSLSILDALVRGQRHGRTTSDNAVLTDSLFRQARLNRTVVDTATATDSVQRRVDMFRNLLDSVTVSDALSVSILSTAIYIRTLHDDISAEDAVQKTIKLLRVSHDDITVMDDIRRQVMMVRFALDGLSVNDALLATGIAYRLVHDDVTITDEARRAAQMFRRILDTASVTDSLISTITLAGVLIVSRVLRDSLDLSDAITRGVKAYRLTREDISVEDFEARTATLTRTMTDVLSVAESMARFLLLSRISTDTIQASDTAVRYALLNRLLQDEATAEDALGSNITYWQELIGFVLMSLMPDTSIVTLEKSAAEVNLARAEPILMELRNI